MERRSGRAEQHQQSNRRKEGQQGKQPLPGETQGEHEPPEARMGAGRGRALRPALTGLAEIASGIATPVLAGGDRPRDHAAGLDLRALSDARHQGEAGSARRHSRPRRCAPRRPRAPGRRSTSRRRSTWDSTVAPAPMCSERGERGHARQARPAADIGAKHAGIAAGRRHAGQPIEMAVLAEPLEKPHATGQPGVAGIAPGAQPGEQDAARQSGDRDSAERTGERQPGADQPSPADVAEARRIRCSRSPARR